MERTWPGAPAGLMTHLTTVLRRMHDSTRGGPYNPMPIVKRIRLLGKQFRPGRQEDSHEFLRCLLDAVLLHELRVRFRALWPCQGLCSSADEPADAPRPVFGLPVQSLDAPPFSICALVPTADCRRGGDGAAAARRDEPDAKPVRHAPPVAAPLP